MQYFLGVDVGGSKSQALVVGADGRIAGVGRAGAGNHQMIGWAGARQVLAAITDQALAQAGLARADVAGAGFGLAGYDWPEDELPAQQAVGSLGLAAPWAVVNDAIVALLAGTPAGWGVVVVAGTSSNCRGRDAAGREGRVTGEEFYGEYGGAGKLVERALQAVALAWTERGPRTRLAEALVAAAGARDVPDLLAGLARRRYRLAADCAPLVVEVAHDGDEVARETVRWGGEQLGSLAQGVIRQLDLAGRRFDVVLSGSFFRSGPLLIEPMWQMIETEAPGASPRRLQAPPAVGGVLLGMKQAGLETGAIYERLIANARETRGA